MSKHFRPWNIDQMLLLPPKVRDFVPRDHVSRFIVGLVRESLDLKAIMGSYVSGRGQPPFGRVEDWRAGLGRCSCSLLSRPFVRECHSISTMPRFQSPPRRTQRADPALRSPVCFAPRAYGTYPAGATFVPNRRTR
jgi:hypothetical protein